MDEVANSPHGPDDFTDTYFVVKRVPKTYAYEAARKATLFRFVGLSRGFRYAEGYLRMWWRSLLLCLYEVSKTTTKRAGLVKKKIQFGRNCPPACSVAQKQSRLCCQAYFCPYCRGRLASAAYLTAVSKSFQEKQCIFDRLSLVIIEQKIPKASSWAKTATEAAAQFRGYDLDGIVRRSSAVAAIAYKQPYVDVEEQQLRLRYGMLLLNAKPIKVDDSQISLHTGPLRRRVFCDAIAEIFAYPFAQFDDNLTQTELLDVYDTITDLTKRHRLFRTYGRFYD